MDDQSPNRAQLRAHRKVFWDAWYQDKNRLPLDPLQVRIVRILHLHPEYHHHFNDMERFLDHDPNSTDTGNFYLHLSLHLAIEEQIAVRQPPEVAAWMEMAVQHKHQERHQALHAALEALGETMAEAQQQGKEPDSESYVLRIKRLIQQ